MQNLESTWREKLRNFIQANLNTFDEEVHLKDSDNIFALGYVNSLFAMRLLGQVEDISGNPVNDEDIVLANFCSIDAMVALINKSMVELGS